MKFTNKQTNFQSKRSPYPTYNNSYVKDGKIEIGENKDFLRVNYMFCHQVDVNGELKEIVINRSDLTFTKSHIPTTMQVGENEVEVYEAILSGEIYDKSKIVNWGMPSLDKVFKMFETNSIINQTGLEFKEITEISVNGTIYQIMPEQTAQISQLMIDWLEQAVFIENEKLGVNFEIETTV